MSEASDLEARREAVLGGLDDLSVNPLQFEPRLIAEHCVEERSEDLQAQNGAVGTDLHMRHMLLSADGTTLLCAAVSTTSLNTSLRTIILPPDILSSTFPRDLTPYTTQELPEPARAIAAYPFFNLSAASTTLLLTSLPHHPIRLTNVLAADQTPVASFPYIYPETEEYLAPHSLLFTPDGQHFLAGADSELSIFDISRVNEGPTDRFKMRHDGPLGASRLWRMKRGIISTMDVSVDDTLAIGTFNSQIGLFDACGKGGLISTFELGEATGGGVTQVKWSACGRYLLVGERRSDVIQVFDIRGQQKLLQTLTGRRADTQKRLAWDLTQNGEVWAGGVDGLVRVWEGIGMTDGEIESSFSWNACDEEAESTIIHPSGTIAITAGSNTVQRSTESSPANSPPESVEGDQTDIDDDDDSVDTESSTENEDYAKSCSIRVWKLC